jgi:hypothetical protein
MTVKKSIKFSDEQYSAIAINADKLNVNISEYIRYRLGVPLKRDYQQFLFHMSRIGNNINQLAKVMNVSRKIGKLDKQEFNIAITRLLAIQAELENLNFDFKAGEFNANTSK